MAERNGQGRRSKLPQPTKQNKANQLGVSGTNAPKSQSEQTANTDTTRI